MFLLIPSHAIFLIGTVFKGNSKTVLIVLIVKMYEQKLNCIPKRVNAQILQSISYQCLKRAFWEKNFEKPIVVVRTGKETMSVLYDVRNARTTAMVGKQYKNRVKSESNQ